jgi:hypothetical protein
MVSSKFFELGVWVRVLALHFFARCGRVGSGAEQALGSTGQSLREGRENQSECEGEPKVSACPQDGQ